MSDKNQQEDGRGHFFAVDRRAWACACGIGMVPVAYLILARGTGGDQRTTAWSINAIEKYTNIGRPRAQKGIKALEKARLIRIVQKGSRPRYHIVPAHEVESAPQPLSDDERRILNLIAEGNNAVPKIGRYDNAWKFGRPYETACALERKGYVRDLGGRRFEIIPGGPRARVSEDPDWIWLPNSLVDGASGEVPPIERVRQTQNIAALRIFIDLYHAHNLADEGGVNWRSPDGFRQKFERLSIGETHQYAVWGFKPGTEEAWSANSVFAPHYNAAQKDGKTFWDAWSLLKTIGLVEMVAHLVEADATDGEPMHPLADGNGEEGERAIWDAALRASTAMATENQIRWAIDQGVRISVPVLKHIGNVQVVGIARLRHRPRTRATAIWSAGGSEWTRWARHYEELAAVAKGREEAVAEGREVRYATSR